MNFYKNKKVLVAGGTGLIGIPLVRDLLEEGAQVRIASLDDRSRAHPDAEFFKADLTDYKNCLDVCEGMDYVFNLLCIKGSPKINKERPASFFDPMLLFNTNLLRAAKESDVENYLFSSTYGVYPTSKLYEDTLNVFDHPPAPNEFFTGLAKRVGEAQAKAYQIEYGWNEISIVRPSNTYGPYDNFDPLSSMVIPSLIRKIVDGPQSVNVWGDGSQIRDFIYSDDVARAMMIVMEKNPGVDRPVNIGSGTGNSIKEIVRTIIGCVENKPEVIYETEKNYGDPIRVMEVSRATSLGFNPRISLDEGIKRTINWYRANKDSIDKRYDRFQKV